jgi:hypothetical protein
MLGGTHVMLGDLATAMRLLNDGLELLRPIPPGILHAFMGFYHGCAARGGERRAAASSTA